MKQIKGFLTFAAICAAIFTQQITSAGDGTYSGTHGNWSDTTRWTGGVVADGADSSATFVGTGSIHLVVTNNATRTIGNIVGNFNNSSYGTTILTNDLESPLILQTTIGSPPPMPKLIQKSGYLNIVAPIQGNQGIEITGVNNYVTLSSSNSTYTGGTLVSSGYLRVGASTELPLTKGPLGVGSLTLMNGTQFSSDGTSARDIHNNIILPGGTVTHGHGTYYGAQRLRGNILLQNDVTLIGSGEQPAILNLAAATTRSPPVVVIKVHFQAKRHFSSIKFVSYHQI